MLGVRPAHTASSSIRVRFASIAASEVLISLLRSFSRSFSGLKASSMWSKVAISGALLVMGGVLSISVVDNFAYVDRSLPVAMPQAKGLAVAKD